MSELTVRDVVMLINPYNDVKLSYIDPQGKKKTLAILRANGRPNEKGVSIDAYFMYHVYLINAAGYMLTELYIY